MSSVLSTQYKTVTVPALQEQFGYANGMQVPKLEKIVLNVGYGRQHKDKAFIDMVEKTLRSITGQQPVHNKSAKSISNFKIREGVPVGASVTLRGTRMYDFLYRLIHLALPRVRDFRGLNPKSFDGHGNYAIGLKECNAFPEITVDSLEKIHGLEIVIRTTAKTDEEAKALLESLGLRFREV